MDLVDQNSEAFLSLGRYALLFETGFCEHCNINSLTLKNLEASDSVNRSDSFFTLLEEGQQYTFEEMYQLWHQKEVYVRLYTMLTPLPIDQRLLTLRQLINGIWSASIQEMQSWSSLENVCWKDRLANGIEAHLDISAD